MQCHAYVWNWDAKIVISGSFAQLLPSHSSGTDIDSAITKSDVMGHAVALVGWDWTHVGVANLFTRVDRNGDKILYLSSRPISHAGPTRGARPKKYAAAWSCWRGTAAIVWRELARRAGVRCVR